MSERAVLISIQPKWVEKIASGKKTIEVRKTKPKLEMPFKCYIYATWNGNRKEILVKQNGCLFCEDYRKASGLQRASGKVIGEFVCDKVENIFSRSRFWLNEDTLKSSCLSAEQIWDYANGAEKIYAWHISDLKIYDKPKELSEFYPIKPKRIEDWTNKDDCAYCKYHKWVGSMQEYVEKGKPMREKCTLGKPEPICEYTPPISRPPKSWCYVEV